MSEPIPDAATGGIPDLAAAAALVDLITLLHTDPLARPLLGRTRYDSPWFWVLRGELHLDFHSPATGAEQLPAAQALFDGTFTADRSRQGAGFDDHVMLVKWRGVPLRVTVEVAREDKLAAAQKRIAELEADAARREAALLDPAVPPLPKSGAAVTE